jgi:hypothetical protein
VRIFKTKTLARFTRQNDIPDSSLVAAVERAIRGLVDADLGGRIIKQLRGSEKEKEGAFACLSALALIVLSSCSASPRTNERISRMLN